MKSFKDRKKAFEEKFAKDLDLTFKAECRACKAFGFYVAEELLGREKEQAERYAADLVIVNLEEPGLEDVLRRVRSDLEKAGVTCDGRKLSLKLESLMEAARDAIIEDMEEQDETRSRP